MQEQRFVAIPGESDDARAVRTRDALATALIALMHDKGFDEISVQEICDRAGVSRSTFYTHFADKDEMFIRHTVAFAQAMGSQLTWDNTAACYRFPIRGMFEHVRQMRPLFESLHKARKVEFIMKVWQSNLATAFEKRVKATRAARTGQSQPSMVLPEIIALQLAGTVITLMTWWMDHHYPIPSDEMEQQFCELVKKLK